MLDWEKASDKLSTGIKKLSQSNDSRQQLATQNTVTVDKHQQSATQTYTTTTGTISQQSATQTCNDSHEKSLINEILRFIPIDDNGTQNGTTSYHQQQSSPTCYEENNKTDRFLGGLGKLKRGLGKKLKKKAMRKKKCKKHGQFNCTSVTCR